MHSFPKKQELQAPMCINVLSLCNYSTYFNEICYRPLHTLSCYENLILVPINSTLHEAQPQVYQQ